MEKQLVTVILISTILGALIGFAMTYVVLQPQGDILIQTLQDQVNDLNENMTHKDNQIQPLQNEVNRLSEEATQKDSEIQLLQQQADNLNKSYAELSEKYEDLLFHYNLLNAPTSDFTTLQDLQITLTTHQTTYYYKDPVSGNVTMTYLDGTPFEGTVDLSVSLVSGGTSGTRFNIGNGFTEWSYEPPAFKWGPGTYRIKISWIWTIDGFVIADPNDAGLPEVLVEAK